MPKQIKRRELDKSVKVSCVLAIAGLAASVVFAVLLIFLLPSLMEDESAVKACLIAAGYFIFTVLSICYMAAAFISYSKAQEAGGLFGGICSAAASLMSLLNLRFVLAMMFSGLKMESVVDKIVGDRTYTEFVDMQQQNWICMVIAMMIMLIIGILGAVKLSRR